MEKSIDKPPHSRTRFGSADLVAALRDIGLAEGDSVFVHSSFKSLGPIKGGALTVIRAWGKQWLQYLDNHWYKSAWFDMG